MPRIKNITKAGTFKFIKMSKINNRKKKGKNQYHGFSINATMKCQ